MLKELRGAAILAGIVIGSWIIVGLAAWYVADAVGEAIESVMFRW